MSATTVAEAIEGLAIGELRSLVESLLAEVARLRAENAALREEVARLQGLSPRPKLKPSGMEKASQPPPQSSGRCRQVGLSGLMWQAAGHENDA